MENSVCWIWFVIQAMEWSVTSKAVNLNHNLVTEVNFVI